MTLLALCSLLCLASCEPAAEPLPSGDYGTSVYTGRPVRIDSAEGTQEWINGQWVTRNAD